MQLKTGRPHDEVLDTWKKGLAAANNVSGGDVGSRGLWWSGIIMRDLQRCECCLLRVVLRPGTDPRLRDDGMTKGYNFSKSPMRDGREFGQTDPTGDVLLDLYETLWTKSPDNTTLGEQILLIASAAWDTPKMVASSRKMFNLTKAPTWARVAAWAEWADVGVFPDSQVSIPNC